MRAASLLVVLAGCGAVSPHPAPPECAGDGEAGAVAAALTTFAHEVGVADDAAYYNEVLHCTVRLEGTVTLSSEAPPRLFARSCWARGGPEDGQCGALGEGRGPAPAMPPPPPAGSYDLVRSWLLAVAELEGEAIVVVTIGTMAQAYRALVVLEGSGWRVVSFGLAWTS